MPSPTIRFSKASNGTDYQFGLFEQEMNDGYRVEKNLINGSVMPLQGSLRDPEKPLDPYVRTH
jgi:glucan phosphorylase